MAEAGPVGPTRPWQEQRRRLLKRAAQAALPATLLAACGGSGDGGPSMEGSRGSDTLVSAHTGTAYPLNFYVPPDSAGPRAGLPVLYVLDGESWFETLVGIVESTRRRLIIVGIHGAGQRSRDFVPVNACTANGGGHAAYFAFIRAELIPYIERTLGGDPGQRVLFGHSHGGSFVLYAMFSQAPGGHTFGAYLASDSSLSCMPLAADEWDRSYAAAHSELPVRLHLSYATQGNHAANLAYAGKLAQRGYDRFNFAATAYSGSHGGIVPQALADGIAFALAPRP